MSAEPTLLVVDDEEAICEGCRRIFSRQGFDVRKCSNASQGLDLAKQTDYSAILLDIKMPEMDGLHFLEALRKEKPEVPVVLMTGYPSIPNAASAIRLGASDYVTKPFTPEEISQAVHRLLHHGRTRPPRRRRRPPPRLRTGNDRIPFLPRCLVSSRHRGRGAGRGLDRSPRRHQDRIRASAADRRSGLSGAAAGRRHRRRPSRSTPFPRRFPASWWR